MPAGKLDLELDEEFHGVERHLGRIADAMDDWETKLAPALDTIAEGDQRYTIEVQGPP